MYDSFFVREDYLGEFFSVEEINEINDSLSTKEPLIIVSGGVGDATGAQILIDVGIGLISAIAYDVLKYVVLKIKDFILEKYIKEDYGNPSPDINIRVDAEAVKVNYVVKINCEASEEDVEKRLKEMKKIAETIIDDNKELSFNTSVV